MSTTDPLGDAVVAIRGGLSPAMGLMQPHSDEEEEEKGAGRRRAQL